MLIGFCMTVFTFNVIIATCYDSIGFQVESGLVHTLCRLYGCKDMKFF